MTRHGLLLTLFQIGSTAAFATSTRSFVATSYPRWHFNENEWSYSGSKLIRWLNDNHHTCVVNSRVNKSNVTHRAGATGASVSDKIDYSKRLSSVHRFVPKPDNLTS